MKSHEEWLRQADYDIDTAEYMLKGGRNFYAVFMCHLSIEKALKGLYAFFKALEPPKTHNLVFLLKEMDIKPPEQIARFLLRLNDAGVRTRYPDDIPSVEKVYSKESARKIYMASKEALTWIRTKL